MDARFFKLLSFMALAIMTGCSNNDASSIDPSAKAQFLAATSLMCGQQSCIPGPILDEQDIVPVINAGYVIVNNQYCLPGGAPGATIQNCIPAQYVDETDLTYLIAQGYMPLANGEYCTPIPDGCGGTTTGGTTTGGGTDVGGTVGGGTVTGGTTTGGDVSAGTTVGGTAGGTDVGGSVTGGTVSGGTVSGGTITGGGSDAGGTVGGGTNGGGTVTGGTTTGGDVSAGTTVGGTAGGTDVGGSVTGGTVSGGTSGSTSGGSCTGGHHHDHDDDDDDDHQHHHDVDVHVDRMCTRLRTGNGKYTILDRKELIMQIHARKEIGKKKYFWQKKEYSFELVCESRDTVKIKNDIVSKRTLDLDACDLSMYNRKDLYVSVFSPVVESDLPISSSDYSNVRFFEKDSSKRGKDELSFMLNGSRDERYAELEERITVIVDNNPDGEDNDPDHCDYKASPLIVHINPNKDVPKSVELTSRENGILYDILGSNSEPKPHTPLQISWLNSNQYMFLVLPNKKGKVVGVDQMFGDNTQGPDGRFAANGFKALAKFDGKSSDGKKQINPADGVISSKDPIFNELRLWNDKNFDGVGTPDELYSLSQMKVKMIDLRYDGSFYEKDSYGNETVYKSVIQYYDGSLDLVFDLWFNYKK